MTSHDFRVGAARKGGGHDFYFPEVCVTYESGSSISAILLGTLWIEPATLRKVRVTLGKVLFTLRRGASTLVSVLVTLGKVSVTLMKVPAILRKVRATLVRVPVTHLRVRPTLEKVALTIARMRGTFWKDRETKRKADRARSDARSVGAQADQASAETALCFCFLKNALMSFAVTLRPGILSAWRLTAA